jgi:iron complex transport system ATP-binding protein
MGKIKWLTKNNRTVLLSTHNPNHVFRFADRVLAICNQKIAALGTPAAVLTEELIGDLYGLEVKLKKDANGAVSCFPV